MEVFASPAQRAVLYLRLGLGWSVERTAEEIGASPEQVRLLQHRALQRLREQLPTAS